MDPWTNKFHRIRAGLRCSVTGYNLLDGSYFFSNASSKKGNSSSWIYFRWIMFSPILTKVLRISMKRTIDSLTVRTLLSGSHRTVLHRLADHVLTAF